MLPSGTMGGMGERGAAGVWVPLLHAKGLPALVGGAASLPDAPIEGATPERC